MNEELMEQVKEDICDNYCKYPGEYKDPDDMYNAVCQNCPLDRLRKE